MGRDSLRSGSVRLLRSTPALVAKGQRIAGLMLAPAHRSRKAPTVVVAAQDFIGDLTR